MSVKDRVPIRIIHSEQRRRSEIDDYLSSPSENIDYLSLASQSRTFKARSTAFTSRDRPSAFTPNISESGHTDLMSHEDEDNLLSIEIKLKRVVRYGLDENSNLRLAVPYKVIAKSLLQYIKTINAAKNKVMLKIPIFPKTSFGKHENFNVSPVQFHSLCYKEVEQIFAEEKIRALKRNNGRVKQNELRKVTNILSLQNSPTKEYEKPSYLDTFCITPTKVKDDRRISLMGRSFDSPHKLVQRASVARMSLHGSPVKRGSVISSSAARNFKSELNSKHSRSVSLHHK
jgi:hypothetical protein